jgi:endo-1,4-beta-xylanase
MPLLTRRDAIIGAAFSPLADPQGEEIARQIKAAAKAKGVSTGSAIEPEPLAADAPYASLMREFCQQVTPENAMKWSEVAPGPDKLDFTRADKVMTWAAEHGARVFGSCLVWHEAVPAWVPANPSARQAHDLLDHRIRSIVGRYRGRVQGWDVVIEAMELLDKRPDGLRRSRWLEALGPDYLAFAYATAHDADPHARLAYSDYGLEHDDVPWMADKRRTVLRMLESLKAKNAPIHAFNIQSHLLGDRPPVFGKALRRFLADVAALGLEIYIGELDVTDQNQGGHFDERDRATGELYRRYLDVVLDEPAVKVVTTWGISDRYNSKVFVAPRPEHDERPLPFDQALKPKPAALAMLEAFRHAPARKPLAAARTA